MRNRMYGGVRGRKTKVGRKLLRFPPTRLFNLKNAVGFKRKAIYLHIIILLWIKDNFCYTKRLMAIRR